MKRILVTGALGQIGSELVKELRNRYGADNVVASDIRMIPGHPAIEEGLFEFIDCTNHVILENIVRKHKIDTIFHLAAVLSAIAETKPQVAWDVNMNGLYAILEVAREHGCAVFTPSSIGAFGPDTPKVDTPQDTLQRPTTMYGVTKVAGEILCDYYHTRFGVDTRGVRYPGLISYVAPPGGGTTDYSVEIFYDAIKAKKYICPIGEDQYMDMMYMPDAIECAIQLMEADPDTLKHRNAFNVKAMSFNPEMLAEEIKKHIPDFVMEYDVDPTKRKIADSWPDSIDTTSAREEWGFNPKYDLSAMTTDMLEKLSEKLRIDYK